MWRVDRQDDAGNWTTLLASPTRVGVDDVRGTSVSAVIGGGDLYASLPTPGNKSSFAGHRGCHARVRYNDTMVELYTWQKVLENPNDPDSDYKWGWGKVAENYSCVPFEALWPQQFG